MSKIRKALAAGAMAGTSALTVAAQDGTVTSQEWATALVAAFLGGYAVWQIPNTPAV